MNRPFNVLDDPQLKSLLAERWQKCPPDTRSSVITLLQRARQQDHLTPCLANLAKALKLLRLQELHVVKIMVRPQLDPSSADPLAIQRAVAGHLLQFLDSLHNSA